MCGPISSLIDAQVLGVIGVHPEARRRRRTSRPRAKLALPSRSPRSEPTASERTSGSVAASASQGRGDLLDLIGRSVGLEIEGDDMMQHRGDRSSRCRDGRVTAHKRRSNTRPRGGVESACSCGLRGISTRSRTCHELAMASAMFRVPAGWSPTRRPHGGSGRQAAYRPTGGRDPRACARSDLEHPTRRAWRPGSCCSARSSAAPGSAR